MKELWWHPRAGRYNAHLIAFDPLTKWGQYIWIDNLRDEPSYFRGVYPARPEPTARHIPEWEEL